MATEVMQKCGVPSPGLPSTLSQGTCSNGFGSLFFLFLSLDVEETVGEAKDLSSKDPYCILNNCLLSIEIGLHVKKYPTVKPV